MGPELRAGGPVFQLYLYTPGGQLERRIPGDVALLTLEAGNLLGASEDLVAFTMRAEVQISVITEIWALEGTNAARLALRVNGELTSIEAPDGVRPGGVWIKYPIIGMGVVDDRWIPGFWSWDPQKRRFKPPGALEY